MRLPSSTPLVTVVVLVTVFGTAVVLGHTVGLPDLAAPSDGDQPGLRRSLPTRVSIPALEVRADVVEVGRTEDGRIATPPGDPIGQTGWYGFGPAPGEPGTAVIVGHVDTRTEPAVFARLASVTPGKLVEISRRDGRVATFAVDSVETFPKTAFPAERIFTPIGRPRLALITCGGRWVGRDVGYSDNVIVFATLI
jgi:hypothetical protein